MEAATASGCRYKVLSRSNPDWTPMRAPLKLAGSFETCPMFTAHLFYNQVKDGTVEQPKHVGSAAFAEAQDRVKGYLKEIEDAPKVLSVSEVQGDEEKKEVKKKEKKEEKKKEKQQEKKEENAKKAENKKDMTSKKEEASKNDEPNVDAALQDAAEILRKELDQKMLVTTFCHRLYKKRSEHRKVVNGNGGIQGFCKANEGRLKFIAGAKAEVQLIEASESSSEPADIASKSDSASKSSHSKDTNEAIPESPSKEASSMDAHEGAVDDERRQAGETIMNILLKHKADAAEPSEPAQAKAVSSSSPLDLSMPAKSERLFGAMSISDLEDKKRAPLPTAQGDLVAITQLGSQRGAKQKVKDSQKSVQQQDKTHKGISSKEERMLHKLLDDKGSEDRRTEDQDKYPPSREKRRQPNLPFLSRLHRRMGQMLMKLDRAEYLALQEYDFADSRDLQALLVKWQYKLPGGAMNGSAQEFIPLAQMPGVEAKEAMHSGRPLDPQLLRAPPPPPPWVDPGMAKMSQFPNSTMPSYVGGAMAPPPLHYPQPPLHYPSGYLGAQPMMMPNMAPFSSGMPALYPQAESGIGANETLLPAQATPAQSSYVGSAQEKTSKRGKRQKATKANAKKPEDAKKVKSTNHDAVSGPDKQGSNKIKGVEGAKVGKNKMERHILSI
eukprot:gnl/MRDRNA2_/MRDRNA2_57958_c0_seq1.p1 gnl/MRDRNA2_/MRDRNA2_57958_c0~~gnl/MRDRNA2_/MRDRNA2_57958_c0_seq1.p1  ORF type:complete len:749 (+),score=196.09 gnl/MRDRNA2_/MRDRNA2_57958_c0_seq1:248-2248(+)